MKAALPRPFGFRGLGFTSKGVPMKHPSVVEVPRLGDLFFLDPSVRVSVERRKLFSEPRKGPTRRAIARQGLSQPVEC